MKNTLIALSLSLTALSMSLIAGTAAATSTPYGDCVGTQACKTNADNHTVTGEQRQQQQQDQTATGGSAVAAPVTSLTTGGYSFYGKSLNINPVQAPSAAMVVPSAEVSRMADPYCGPRQKVMSRDVNGRVIGIVWDTDVPLGENQWLTSDLDQPYRRIEVIPGQLSQLIGHKVHETTTVLTVSTSGALAFGGNGSSGAGGSFGGSRGGALQQMVTTIRLQDCIAYEIVPKQKELPKVKPAPKKKPAPKQTTKPCDVCQRPQLNLTVNVQK